MSTRAIVRKPGRNFADGITSSHLGKPDFEKTLAQHDSYCKTLSACRLELIVMDADLRYPDGCFVEDTAVVFDEAAIITRPGAASRRGEETEISILLAEYREIHRIVAPGTLDGGDILKAGRHFYIGRSSRTNSEGARQLGEIAGRYGYTSSEITVKEGLHLKSGLEYIGNGTFVSGSGFQHAIKGSKIILLKPEEEYSANCLLVNGTLLIPQGFPDAKKQLTESGYNITEVDMSEFQKMDGGLTCLSLIF